MKILIVDDEKNVRESLGSYLNLSGLPVAEAQNGLSAKRMLQEEVFAALVLDIKMPGMSGIELLKWIRAESIRIPVIMISAHGDVSDAVEAMKLGAADYLIKPFDPDELLIRLNRVIEETRLKTLAEFSRLDIINAGELIGDGPSIAAIKKTVAKVAPTSATVLLTGESGVGKEVVARTIHSSSSAADGPFVGINLGAVPESLIESELFGHEKGAFTGAVMQKAGMFELASGGTLFLDEIGEMPKHLQVKLLRVLQERKIQRVGGTRSIPVNARIMAATNRDLETQISEGSFREDLFYRLNVVNINIPPLRARIEDIPALSVFLLNKHNRSMGRQFDGFTAAALQALAGYSWPGNVRELENTIERAVIFAEGSSIDTEDLPLPGDELSTSRQPLKKLKEAERDLIIEALHVWEGNRTKAAESLGITRRTLFSKIQEYGLQKAYGPQKSG
jgi:two-component system, NtrC family, response regulator AtoC